VKSKDKQLSAEKCAEVVPFLRYCVVGLLDYMEKTGYAESMDELDEEASVLDVMLGVNELVKEMNEQNGWDLLADLAYRINDCFEVKSKLEAKAAKVKGAWKLKDTSVKNTALKNQTTGIWQD